MGKRHRKGKCRYANTSGLDDILDEQMVEPVPEETNYSKRSKRSNKKSINTRGKVPGKIDRNQRRKRPNLGAKQQRNIFQKGKEVVNATDEDTYNEGNSTGADLRSIIEKKKVRIGMHPNMVIPTNIEILRPSTFYFWGMLCSF